jgi:WD40 repeat protein
VAIAGATALALLTVLGVAAAFYGISQEAERTRRALNDNQRLLALNHLQLGSSQADAQLPDAGLQEMIRGYQLLAAEDELKPRVASIINNRLNRMGHLLAHEYSVQWFAFSGDATRLATTDGHEVCVWETTTGRPLSGALQVYQAAPNGSAISPLALNRDGSLLAAYVSGNQSVFLCDLTRFQVSEPRRLELEQPALAMAFASDGALHLIDETGAVYRLAAGSSSTSLVVPALPAADRPSGQAAVAAFTGEGSAVCRMENQSLCTYSLADGQRLHDPISHNGPVFALRPSRTGRFVLCHATDHFCFAEQGLPETFRADVGLPYDVQFSYDERSLLTYTGDSVRAFAIGELQTPPPPASSNTPGRAAAADPSPSRPFTLNRTLQLAGVGSVLFERGALNQRPGAELAAVLSPSGRYLVTRHSESALRLHDVGDSGEGGRLLGNLSSTRDEQALPRYAGRFTKNGKAVVLTAGARPAAYDLAASRSYATQDVDRTGGGLTLQALGERLTLLPHLTPGQQELKTKNQVSQLSASSDGKYLVGLGRSGDSSGSYYPNVVDPNALGFWDDKLKPIDFRAFTTAIRDFQLAEHGARVVVLLARQGSISSFECQLWFLDRLKTSGDHVTIAYDVVCAALSPDGRWLATADDRNIVTLVDAGSGRVLGNRLPHPSRVGFLGFDATGQTLISGCRDSTVRLWDIRTRLPLTYPFRADREITWAMLSPDQRHLVAINDQSDVFLWRLPLDSTADPTRRSELATQQHLLPGGQPRPLDWRTWRELWDSTAP